MHGKVDTDPDCDPDPESCFALRRNARDAEELGRSSESKQRCAAAIVRLTAPVETLLYAVGAVKKEA